MKKVSPNQLSKKRTENKNLLIYNFNKLNVFNPYLGFQSQEYFTNKNYYKKSTEIVPTQY